MSVKTGIYNNGKVLTSSDLKKYTIKQRGWTEARYNKEYDKLRNRLRNFEKFTGAEKQSVAELLYKETKSMKRHGADYKRSIPLQRIYDFTSVSTGKAFTKLLESESFKTKTGQKYEKATYGRFGKFIEKNEKAKEIWQNVKDPVKREKALSEYANEIHAKIKEQSEEIDASAIPIPRSDQTFGSKSDVEFDYSQYI